MGQGIDQAGADRIAYGREHDRQSAADMLQRHYGQGAAGQDDVRREGDQFRSRFCALVGTVVAPAGVDPHIAANTPAHFLQALVERRKSIVAFWIIHGAVHKHADPPHPLGLLRARRERPRGCAAEQRDELAAPHHSITSSAIASSPGGKLRPNALAVLRLITNSNLVDCMTGKSAGFAPLRTRPTYTPPTPLASLLLLP